MENVSESWRGARVSASAASQECRGPPCARQLPMQTFPATPNAPPPKILPPPLRACRRGGGCGGRSRFQTRRAGGAVHTPPAGGTAPCRGSGSRGCLLDGRQKHEREKEKLVSKSKEQ